MIRFRNFLNLVLATLVGVAILGAPSQADAAFKLRISTNGGTDFGPDIDDGGTGEISVMVGAMTIRATANDFISTASSFLALHITGLAATTTYDLVVQASMDGINTAPAPQTLHYEFTGSVVPAQLTAQFRTWVDDANGLFGLGTVVADTTSLSPTAVGNIGFTASDPYSATTEFHLTGTNTSVVSLSLDSNNNITPAPEPGILTLCLTGLPVFGLGAWRRRRQTRSKA